LTRKRVPPLGESCDVVIAVDPGQEPAYAVAHRVGTSAFSLDLVAQTDMNQVFGVLARYSRAPRRGLVVEDQFIGQQNHLVGLIRNAQTWVAYAELLQYAPVVRLYPNSWIARAIGGHCTRMARKARKAAARAHCEALGLDVSRLSHDQCDAVCILQAVLGARLICAHAKLARH